MGCKSPMRDVLTPQDRVTNFHTAGSSLRVGSRLPNSIVSPVTVNDEDTVKQPGMAHVTSSQLRRHSGSRRICYETNALCNFFKTGERRWRLDLGNESFLRRYLTRYEVLVLGKLPSPVVS